MIVIKKILFITLPIFFGGVLLLSCSNREEIDRNKGEILSVLINREANSIMNPPLSKTIRRDSARILLYHKLEPADFEARYAPCDFRPLSSEFLKNLDKEQLFDLDLRHLKLDPNIKIIVSNDSIIRAMDRKWANYRTELGIQLILSFSEVVLNKEMDMAIVDLGVSEGADMAWGITYFFRKIGVTWTIVDVLEGSMS